MHLELKLPALDLKGRLASLPLKNSEGYITDDGEEAVEQLLNNTNNGDTDVDDCEEAILSTSIISNENVQLDMTINHSKSGDGWLWISNVTGNSEDPYDAMLKAVENLKCRYAYSSQLSN